MPAFSAALRFNASMTHGVLFMSHMSWFAVGDCRTAPDSHLLHVGGLTPSIRSNSDCVTPQDFLNPLISSGVRNPLRLL